MFVGAGQSEADKWDGRGEGEEEESEGTEEGFVGNEEKDRAE